MLKELFLVYLYHADLGSYNLNGTVQDSIASLVSAWRDRPQGLYIYRHGTVGAIIKKTQYSIWY